MGMIAAFNEFERGAQYLTERSFIMPNNRQTAASFRAIQSECTYDNVAAQAHRFSDAFGVCSLVVRFSQEMKRCTVVPDIISLAGLPCRNICDDPFDMTGTRAKPSPRCWERLFPQMEHCDGVEAFIDQGIDQPGCAAADINN